MSGDSYDVIVIGSGITGLTATKHLMQSGSGLTVANIEAETFGGLVLNVNELDGKIQGSGVDLASGLMMEAADLGAAMLSESVSALTESAGKWTVATPEGHHHARAIIVASGASLRKLGIPGEDKFEHRGVSRCADCDGPMYQGKDIVVVGGGDSALQEAHVLSRFCRQVHLINRTKEFAAKPHLVKAIEGCDNVVVRHLTEANEILGNAAVEKVRIRQLADNAENEIACSGFFGFIGLKPSSDFVPSSVSRDPDGFLITDSSLRAAQGLFAAGAVRSGYGGMLEHAIEEGLIAANEAIRIVRATH
jgi:thioredoxin reductase (NADPH)